jgi:hypothetical protein
MPEVSTTRRVHTGLLRIRPNQEGDDERAGDESEARVNCKGCDLAEHRVINQQTGREETNLDPSSGLCVDCLASRSRSARRQREPFDAKVAALPPGDRD